LPGDIQSVMVDAEWHKCGADPVLGVSCHTQKFA
jgi:hypothetical protein